jgi:phage/plasmid-associated DNA primase
MKGDCLVDAEWFAKLDNMPYKVAFQDGVYDLKKCRFRKKLYAMDYLTKTIPMNYKKADPLKKVAVLKELKKICNWKDLHLDRYLSQYGYMMCGDAQREQVFFNYKGETASNGKSVVPEALSAIMPCYCKAMGSDTFEVSNKSQVHKVIATWRGLRIVWVNETDKNAQQDPSLLKKVCEGTPVSFKRMYGDQEDMEITFKVLFIGNQELKVKDADGGVGRRWIMNQLDSDFQDYYTEDNYESCQFVKDKSFQKKLIEDYKYELLEIIFDYSKMYCDEGKMKDVPIEWIEEKEAVLDTNRPVEDFIRNTFEWEEGHLPTQDA